MTQPEHVAEANAASLLKDHINRQSITQLAGLIKRYQVDFPVADFIEQANEQLELMPLKARVTHLSTVLATLLVDDYSQNAHWLKQLAKDCVETQFDMGWRGFIFWPLIDYAGRYGLDQPEVALNLLKHLTPLFTAEFAIRPFIEHHFELTYRHLLQWCDDSDEHVRRLASEGLRPRLPWGGHLKAMQLNPEPVITLLSCLKDDNSRYVQKSVANNLNDISKDHPQRVIAVCREWLNEATPQRQWIIRHGLRSLIKAGEPAVFSLLGYSDRVAVKADFMVSEQQVTLGDATTLQATIHSLVDRAQKLVVDYRIWHVKANGKRTGKVYKWKNIELLGLARVELTKIHAFLKLTTRQYYSGRHTIELLINGVSHAQAELILLLE